MYYLVPVFMLLAFFAGVDLIRRRCYSLFSLAVHAFYFVVLFLSLFWFIARDTGLL